MTRYQIYVHFRVAKSPPAAIARDHTTVGSADGLLSYQVNGKVFIHLEQKEKKNAYGQELRLGKFMKSKFMRTVPPRSPGPAGTGAFRTQTSQYRHVCARHTHTFPTFPLDASSNLQKCRRT